MSNHRSSLFIQTRFILGLRFILGALLLFGLNLGCAAPQPDVGALAAEVTRLQVEAERMATASESREALQASQDLKSRAESREKPAEQVPDLTESAAAARVALVSTVALQREAEASECYRVAQSIKREWEDALNMLTKTEDSAQRKARGVDRLIPLDPSREELPEMPPFPGDGLPDSMAMVEGMETWTDLAREYSVPVADLQSRILEALEATRGSKIEPLETAHQYNLAGWACSEMAYRVRADVARRDCLEDQTRAITFAESRDKTLWAMMELERGKAANREQDLYRNLKQFEGQFASIRQEARGTILSLSDILFDTGKSELRVGAKINLAKVAVILEQFPEMGIRVEGHTDNVGSEEYNLKLSENRARSVFEFLVEQGVEAGRMTTQGLGFSQPVADNDTPEGRQQNRRVDLIISEEEG